MTEEREALQELITEAHQVLKDLRRTIGLAQAIRDDVAKVAAAQTTEMIDTVVTAQIENGLANYRVAIDAAIDNADKAIFARFDAISNMLLHGTTQGPKSGNDTELEQAVRKIVQERGYG